MNVMSTAMRVPWSVTLMASRWAPAPLWREAVEKKLHPGMWSSAVSGHLARWKVEPSSRMTRRCAGRVQRQRAKPGERRAAANQAR